MKVTTKNNVLEIYTLENIILKPNSYGNPAALSAQNCRVLRQ